MAESSPSEGRPDTAGSGWPVAPPVPVADGGIESDPVLLAEAATIAQAQTGDRTAMRLLYEQNVPMVYSFVARRVGREMADDITAEVFTKAFERLDRFEWRGIAIRSWLLRIAFNEIVGRTRRRSATEVLTDNPERGGVAGHEDTLLDAMASGDALLDALAGLSPPQRAAIELRYLRDLSVTETAVVLDLQEDAVRALTYRALKALRSMMPADVRGAHG